MNIRTRSLNRIRRGSKLKSLVRLMGKSAKALFVQNQDDIDIKFLEVSTSGVNAGKITVREIKAAIEKTMEAQKPKKAKK